MIAGQKKKTAGMGFRTVNVKTAHKTDVKCIFIISHFFLFVKSAAGGESHER